MRRQRGTAVAVALVGVALAAAGCDSGDFQSADGAGTAVATSATSQNQSPSGAVGETMQAQRAPERVVVHRPGLLDTSLTVEDVPAWPGPDPSEFLTPHYPSGESGELTGGDAARVYAAALGRSGALIEEDQELPKYPDRAVWAAEGDVQWLVVEPQR